MPTPRRMRGGLFILSIALLVQVARAGNGSVQVGSPGNSVFIPSTVVISQGESVEWFWASGSHTVTSGTNGVADGLFDNSGGAGHTFSFTFPNSGNYRYFCRIHGVSMSGTVAVLPASASPTPTPTPTPIPNSALALNISTRMRVETGSNVLIGGFIISGTSPKNVAVRGIGPSLTQFGITGVLADPTLELRDSGGALIAQDDDWQDDSGQAAQLTNLGLALSDTKESGLVTTLQAGAAYTAILAGKNSGTGVGLVEIYDTNHGPGSQLANISTRGFVMTGNNVMIGGFILGGESNSTRVAVRGIGPSLSEFGLSPVLANPTLELRDTNGTLLISNDDWEDDAEAASQLANRGLGLSDPSESGIFQLLPPGAFTAILAGTSGGTGIGLVEIYNVH